jgi:undecaprenyl-diphosphatase
VSSLFALDESLRSWVVTHRFAALNPIMWSISAVGEGGMVWLATAAVLTVMRRMRPLDLVRLAATVLTASLLVNEVVKPIVGRQRPFTAIAAIQTIGVRPGDASFPSGHAANAFAGCYVLSGSVGAARIIWWTLAVSIAYSRVYVGVHYPLDVIGGALFGWLCGLVVERVLAHLRSREPASLR